VLRRVAGDETARDEPACAAGKGKRGEAGAELLPSALGSAMPRRRTHV